MPLTPWDGQSLRIFSEDDDAPSLGRKGGGKSGQTAPIVYVGPSSPESEDSTSDSPEPDGSMPSSASPTNGDEESSPPTSPESPSSKTSVRSTRPHGPVDSDLNDERWEEQETHPTLTPDATTQNTLVAETWAVTERTRADGRNLESQKELAYALDNPGEGGRAQTRLIVETWAFETRYVRNGRGEPERETVMPLKAQSGRTGKGDSAPLIFETLSSSPEDSPAKTSQSPGSEPDSTATDPDSSSSSPASLTLFDLAGYSWRTFPVSTQALDEIGTQGLTAAALTSQLFLERWPASGTYSPGELSIAVSSECRSDDDGCSSLASSLTEILEPPQDVPEKYSLSARAAAGILRRAEKRGRELPEHLRRALTTVAQSKDGSAKAEDGQPPPKKPPRGT